MSKYANEIVKRLTAKRKAALVLEIIQGKTPLAKASRSFDLTQSETDALIYKAKNEMEISLRSEPRELNNLSS